MKMTWILSDTQGPEGTYLSEDLLKPRQVSDINTPSIQYKGFENSFSTGLPLDRPKFSVFNTLRKPLAVNNNFLLCHPVINSCSIVDHVFFCIFNFVYKAKLYFSSVKSMYRGEMPSYI